ncbi:MAG: caspase family protein [Rubrivivax sp.]|nr:caspase family protein [Rubrivivax sp.]
MPQPPSRLPQVRVVQEMHSARVDQIRADAAFEVLLTISNDKSLRLWRIADLRLVRTILLPSEPGPEGTPYAVAISADGRRAFVGGYTGWHWHRASRVYAIDLATGLITATLGRFADDVVTAMDLSPDGRRLAVGLARGGLVVIDAATGATLNADREYAAPVSFAHHGPDGRLATTAADGCLRVYAADGTLAFRNQYPLRPAGERQCTGGELGGVRFSPDGHWLALGTRYLRQGERWQPEVALFDAQALTLRRTVRTDDAEQRNLCCIAWAPDSSALFVNGTAESGRPTPLFRIRGPDSGAFERWEVGRQQFTNMLPLPDGTVIFATNAPSIAKLGPDGRVATEALPGNIDFHATRERPESFLVAPDGRGIAFEAGAGRWLLVDPFAPDTGAALRAAAVPPGGLRAARRSGALKVVAATGLFSHREPVTVNGAPVALGFEEGVRSWAVHPTLPIAALGTQHGVRLVDAQGRPLPGWEQPSIMPAPVWHTVITDDGRFVVVAVGDGTVRWFEVASGRERLGLFVHANAADWVAWRADGHYASSPAGDQYIGWLVNRGDAATPDFFRAVQFERTLYRPDLVRSSLGSGEPGKATAGGQALAETLARLSAPRVRIESVSESTREVRFTAEATGRPVREVGVYVEGLPVLATAARAVPAGQRRITRTVVVPAGLPLDRIRVEAESDGGLGLDEVAALRPAHSSTGRGRLWVLAVGVRNFDAFAACGAARRCEVEVGELPNAPNDAATLAQRLGARFGGLFSEVRMRVLAHRVSAAPTKAAVMQALRELEAAGPQDTVLVFIASHGVAAGPEGNEYYFLPADVQPAALEHVLAVAEGRAPPPGSSADTLLSATELNAVLRRVAGRRVVAIDTCHAGAAGISSNPYLIAKRSASAQYALITAASGSELAYEHVDPRVRHGAFTHALLSALDGAADADADGAVTLEEAFRFVLPEVQRNMEQINAAERRRDPGHKPFTQTPVLYANPALRASALGLAAPPPRR